MRKGWAVCLQMAGHAMQERNCSRAHAAGYPDMLYPISQAEYVTPQNKVNQVVLWDSIIQQQVSRAHRRDAEA